MNERDRRMYEHGKAEIAVGRFVYGMYLVIAVVSTTAISASLSSAILNILPDWANITLAASGGLNLPSSVQALPKMRKWIKDADQKKKELEVNNIDTPVDFQNECL